MIFQKNSITKLIIKNSFGTNKNLKKSKKFLKKISSNRRNTLKNLKKLNNLVKKIKMKI